MMNSSLIYLFWRFSRKFSIHVLLFRNLIHSIWIAFVLICLFPHFIPSYLTSAHLISRHQARAQSSSTRWQDFKQDDGLISSDVWSILTTRDSVWFGTNLGISYFNGEWESYPAGNTHSLNDLSTPIQGDSSQNETALSVPPPLPHGRYQALALFVANGTVYDETIWAGTDTGFVVSRHPQTGVWSQILTLESEIYALLVADHTLWIGTERGLYQLSLASASGMFSDGSQRKLQAERVHMNGQQDFPVFSLFAWDKTIWVGSYSGLWRYEKDQWSRIPIPGRAAYTSGESLRCLDSTIGEIDSPVTA